MRTVLVWLLLVGTGSSGLAQKPLRYALWADGLVNLQLPKSALYFLGTGLRAEVGKPIGHSQNALFAQVGYAHFFRKPTSAFTADLGLVNAGYRYQSRRAFGASVGVGLQYWRERMQLRLSADAIDETLTSLIPSATIGLGLRIRSRYRAGLENRVLLKPEPGSPVLRNNLTLSLGYTL